MTMRCLSRADKRFMEAVNPYIPLLSAITNKLQPILEGTLPKKNYFSICHVPYNCSSGFYNYEELVLYVKANICPNEPISYLLYKDIGDLMLSMPSLKLLEIGLQSLGETISNSIDVQLGVKTKQEQTEKWFTQVMYNKVIAKVNTETIKHNMFRVKVSLSKNKCITRIELGNINWNGNTTIDNNFFIDAANAFFQDLFSKPDAPKSSLGGATP